MMQITLPEESRTLNSGLQQLERESVVERIWARDHTIWAPDPAEIINRLGWLDIPQAMAEKVGELNEFRDSLAKEGVEKVIVLGMGGSSLAPDVFQRTFDLNSGYPILDVLDTTHPDAIREVLSRLDLSRTAFIVATKSGTTVETLSLFRFFYNEVLAEVGKENAGGHFIAITDPGSPLTQLAREYNFRKTFINDPEIGGRYSALSYFGLVPAAIMGIDLAKMLDDALSMCSLLKPEVEIGENHGAVLGTVLGTLANGGRNKLTFIASAEIEPFGDWAEQLIAESTGKQGRGILPVVGEAVGDVAVYADDRVFIHLRWRGDKSFDSSIAALSDAGHPTITFDIDSLSALGGMFFLWEFATAVAGYWLEINPFDQPNVESAKIRAKEMVAEYRENGRLPLEDPFIEADGAVLFTDAPGVQSVGGQLQSKTIEKAIAEFIAVPSAKKYVSIQAYLQPTEATTSALRELQRQVRDTTGLATTVGYGPRFLHSTGQLHKGDAGYGLFLQITDESTQFVPIPEQAGSSKSSITFNTLIDAQAMGDRRALVDAGRSAIRVHIIKDPIKMITALLDSIKQYG